MAPRRCRQNRSTRSRSLFRADATSCPRQGCGPGTCISRRAEQRWCMTMLAPPPSKGAPGRPARNSVSSNTRSHRPPRGSRGRGGSGGARRRRSPTAPPPARARGRAPSRPCATCAPLLALRAQPPVPAGQMTVMAPPPGFQSGPPDRWAVSWSSGCLAADPHLHFSPHLSCSSASEMWKLYMSTSPIRPVTSR